MMAHTQVNFGVIIYIDGNYTENTNIGLFHTSDTLASMILCAAPDAGGNFASGILMENGIDPIEKSIDLRYGGNTEEISGTQIVLNNTGDYAAAGDTLSKYFYDEGIKIQGCKCDIFEFSIIDATYVYNLLFSGICQNPTWNETEYIIPIEPHVNETSVSSVIDSVTYPYAPDDSIGKLVPVVFGNVENARGILVSKHEIGVTEILQDSIILKKDDTHYFRGTAGGFGSTYGWSGKAMKIVGKDGASSDGLSAINIINCKFAIEGLWSTSSDGEAPWVIPVVPTTMEIVYAETSLMTMRVLDGLGNGQIRKVKRIYIDDIQDGAADLNILNIELFEALSEDISIVAANNSWATLYGSEIKYSFSDGVNIGFLNDSLLVDTSPIIPSSFDSGSRALTDVAVSKMLISNSFDPNYFKLTDGDFSVYSDNNSLRQDSKSLDNESLSYQALSTIIPDIEFPTDSFATIDNDWFYPIICASSWFGAGLSDTYESAGHYFGTDNDALSFITSVVGSNDETKVNTKVLADSSNILTTWTKDQDTTFYDTYICKIVMPPKSIIPNNFDKILISARIVFTYYNHNSGVGLNLANLTGFFWKEFDRVAHAIGTPKNISSGNPYTVFSFHNLHDRFYIPPENVSSGIYYYPQTEYLIARLSNTLIIPGQLLYEIDDVDYDSYEKIKEMCFISSSIISGGFETMTGIEISVEIGDLSLSFLKNTSTKTIYNNFGGIARAVDETWNTRRTEETIVSGPIEILEKISLDTGDSVDQSNVEGGFYYAGDYLAEALTDFDGKICRQINDFDASKVSDIRKTICADTFLAHYTTPPTGFFSTTNGRACVSDIICPYYENGATVAASFDIADVIGDISPINENSIENVFCEPQISYKFDYGKDDFSEILSVTNSDKATYNAAYVIDTSGTITESDKESLWDQSRALYLHYKQVNTPPSELVETFWISDPAAALAKMNRWYKWMGCYTADASIDVSPRSRIRFSVAYADGKSLRLCNHINIDFPSHTFGVSREALIDKISIDINSAIVTLECSLYPEQPVQQFAIKDTFNTGVLPSWKDTLTETALNEIKDTFA